MGVPFTNSNLMTATSEAHRLTELEKIRILIVDDDPVFRRSLFRVLSGAGYNVFTAANIPEALEFLSQLDFSLVLMDMPKPYQGGIDELRTLLASIGNANIIVVSTFSERKLQQKVLKMGAKGFLVKPVRKAAILEAVSKALPK